MESWSALAAPRYFWLLDFGDLARRPPRDPGFLGFELTGEEGGEANVVGVMTPGIRQTCVVVFALFFFSPVYIFPTYG